MTKFVAGEYASMNQWFMIRTNNFLGRWDLQGSMGGKVYVPVTGTASGKPRLAGNRGSSPDYSERTVDSCWKVSGVIAGICLTKETMSHIAPSFSVLPQAGMALILIPCLMIQNAL